MASTQLKPIDPPTATPSMRMRNFRCDDETWDAAMARAKADGLDLSAVIRHYLRGYAESGKRQSRSR